MGGNALTWRLNSWPSDLYWSEYEQQALTAIVARTTRSVSHLPPQTLCTIFSSRQTTDHPTTNTPQPSDPQVHQPIFHSHKPHKSHTLPQHQPSQWQNPTTSTKPTAKMTLERARLLLDQMDQQLLEIHERSIVIRKAILVIKTKLLDDKRKRRDSETF
jgi:hypothetical protein